MVNFIRGQKSKLQELGCGSACSLEVTIAAGAEVDLACFGLDGADKLSDDRFMVFYNQPNCPGEGIGFRQEAQSSYFALKLDRLPDTIQKLVFTLAITDDGKVRDLGSCALRLGTGEFKFSGGDFANERAIILAELYRRDNVWRFGVVGQGFDEGLAALVRHFGGELADAQPAPVQPQAQQVSLLKKVEQAAPHLVNLVKQATVSLDKVGLGAHKAKVCLVLDISGSMRILYKNGLVQAFAERILALGCKFDDDQSIDVFLFGQYVHQVAPMGLHNNAGFIAAALVQHPLEGDTCYGLAMEAVRDFYFPAHKGCDLNSAVRSDMPVYVMFVTDGTTSDKPRTEKQLRKSSYEAIFWQFMGIGKGKKAKVSQAVAESDFPFLEKLDELTGRFIDNANYFSVRSPDELTDSQLYDLLMQEYPAWLQLAKNNGLLN